MFGTLTASDFTEEVLSAHFDGSTWSALQTVPVPDEFGVSSRFGESLVIDGLQAVIGAPGNPQELEYAHLYTWSNDAWRFVEHLTPFIEDWRGGTDYGVTVDMSDGYIFVGAAFDRLRTYDTPTDGAVYVFSNEPAFCFEDGRCVCEQGTADCESP